MALFPCNIGSSGGTVEIKEHYSPPLTTFPVSAGEQFVGRTYEFIASLPSSTGNCTILSFGGSNSAGGVISFATGRFSMFVTSSYRINDYSIALDQTKRHYAIIIKASTVELYVNKSLYKTYNATASDAMKYFNNFVIGANESAPTTENFNGGTIYDFALTKNADGTFIL